MISSAGTAGARRLVRSGVANKAAPERAAHHNQPHQPARQEKRAREEPCEDELAHRALHPQKEQLLRAIAAQTSELVDLEKGLLDLYFTQAICPLEDQPPAALVAAIDDASVTTSPSPSPSATSTKTAYYHQSQLAQLRLALQRSVQGHKQDEHQAVKDLKALEEQVDRDIITGLLAEQQRVAEAEEAAYRDACHALERQSGASAALVEKIKAEEAALAALQAEEDECANRKATLEERKRKQMDNVESTRQELQAMREATQAAQKELKRREAVVRELQKEIDRRRDRLRKRKLLT